MNAWPEILVTCVLLGWLAFAIAMAVAVARRWYKWIGTAELDESCEEPPANLFLEDVEAGTEPRLVETSIAQCATFTWMQRNTHRSSEPPIQPHWAETGRTFAARSFVLRLDDGRTIPIRCEGDVRLACDLPSEGNATTEGEWRRLFGQVYRGERIIVDGELSQSPQLELGPYRSPEATLPAVLQAGPRRPLWIMKPDTLDTLLREARKLRMVHVLFASIALSACLAWAVCLRGFNKTPELGVIEKWAFVMTAVLLAAHVFAWRQALPWYRRRKFNQDV